MKRIYLVLAFIFAGKLLSGQITLVNFSTGYSSPVDIKHCGDDRMFIVEQAGYISICDPNGIRRPDLFLDIHARVRSGGEQGLLGLAFPPDYLTSGYFYVNYTGLDDDTRISRFHVDLATNPDSADPNSEEILLVIYQPFSNHNGGHLAFGKDGYLYIGTGDGGSGGDPGNRAQNPDSLLGKMLRLEVDPSYSGYHIPPTNMFANDTTLGRPEIWALGMRNPWRFSFDKAKGDLWIGDVGQGLVEEVDFEPYGTPSGLNFGWKCWEGSNQYSTAGCQPYSFYEPPVREYSHTGGNCSITGGYIYRGTKYQELYGKYFYADYCNSQLQYLEADGNGGFVNTNLGSIGASSITGFGEDSHGEVYLTSGGANIMHITSATCAPVSTINFGLDTISDCGAGVVLLSSPEDSSSTYDWTLNSTSVGTTASHSATQAGTYYVTVTNLGCTSTDSIVVLATTPAPVTFTGLDTMICVYHNPVILFPNIPGGTFSGPGINGSGFFPAVAGLGSHNVTYTLTDAAGCVSTHSQPVTVDACLGVPENSLANTVLLVPNPASGNFHIKAFSSLQKAVEVKISDIAGRLVLNESYIFNVGENAIPVELNVPAGIYHVRLSDESSSVVIQMIMK